MLKLGHLVGDLSEILERLRAVGRQIGLCTFEVDRSFGGRLAHQRLAAIGRLLFHRHDADLIVALEARRQIGRKHATNIVGDLVAFRGALDRQFLTGDCNLSVFQPSHLFEAEMRSR